MYVVAIDRNRLKILTNLNSESILISWFREKCICVCLFWRSLKYLFYIKLKPVLLYVYALYFVNVMLFDINVFTIKTTPIRDTLTWKVNWAGLIDPLPFLFCAVGYYVTFYLLKFFSTVCMYIRKKLKFIFTFIERIIFN